MITNVCECQDCKEVIEYERRITEPVWIKCPLCDGPLETLIYPPIFFVRQDAKTVGQLAERNAKAMGKYGVQAADFAHKEKLRQDREKKRFELEKKLPPGAKLLETKSEEPWFGSLSPKMSKSVTEGKNVSHYIMTGEEK